MATGSQRNPRLFVLFRLLFNCRFYYPIYLVLFLDFGLSLAQFATLNLDNAYVSGNYIEVLGGAGVHIKCYRAACCGYREAFATFHGR